ncbi:hypothetical protein EUX98_g6867 [Antrodiella citrinella]|uniref:NADAR domain-containing protein n=1 Tax=Antrodiella citrinella TaxID=2447956 RepID=A0A4S4MMY8_9APHY|nr:hypothetical protein EUX98_g6867 [Antrodiella citrinella]
MARSVQRLCGYSDAEWIQHIDFLRWSIYYIPSETYDVLEDPLHATPSGPSSRRASGASDYRPPTPHPNATSVSRAVPVSPAIDTENTDSQRDRSKHADASRRYAYHLVQTSREDVNVVDNPSRAPIVVTPKDPGNTDDAFQRAQNHSKDIPRSSTPAHSPPSNWPLGHGDFTSVLERRHSNVSDRDEGERKRRRRSSSLCRAAAALKRSYQSLRGKTTNPDQDNQDPAWNPDIEPAPIPVYDDQLPIEFRTYDKTGPYYGFSTFSPHPVMYEGKWYPTCVHLHQSFKFRPSYPDIAERIRKAGNDPFDAIEVAHRYERETREDWWGTPRFRKMTEILLLKFSQHPHLRRKLLSTGSKDIYHISREDRYWGCTSGPEYRGRNMLGQALQNVRDMLRDLSL